jgi:hypothetical protein
MELKYKNEISQFNNCDLASFKEIEMESFRWTFEDINDIRNFEPIYINDSKRKRENCLGFALSFFTTQQASIKRHKELTLDRPNLYKKLGTHIASGQLSTTDGIASNPDEVKHFDFFTYENVSLNNKFTILESIA